MFILWVEGRKRGSPIPGLAGIALTEWVREWEESLQNGNGAALKDNYGPKSPTSPLDFKLCVERYRPCEFNSLVVSQFLAYFLAEQTFSEGRMNGIFFLALSQSFSLASWQRKLIIAPLVSSNLKWKGRISLYHSSHALLS